MEGTVDGGSGKAGWGVALTSRVGSRRAARGLGAHGL